MASSSSPRPRAGWRWVLSTGLLAAFWLAFFQAHLKASIDDHRPVGLGLMALELVYAILFVARRQPLVVSRSPVAWIAAAVGGFGMLLSRPDYDPVGGLGGVYLALQLAGAFAASVTLLFLGRSFGIVAANRGVQTRGPYRLVRHPAYASYLLVMSGYLLENPSVSNLLIIASVLACQIVRIEQEEACLVSDPEYAEYRRQVRYRLVPFVY